MSRLTLLITLLTIVYSWEQLKDVVAILFAKIFKRHKTARDYARLDGLVGTILIVATLPITLAYWIMDQGASTDRLLVIIVQLFLTGLLLMTLEVIQHRSAGLLMGLLSQPFTWFTHPSHDRKIIARLAVTAALPLMLAVAIKQVSRTPNIDFNLYLERLTLVAMLGLVLLVSIELLEKLFRSRKLALSGYLRVVLGIIVITVLAGPK